MSKVVWRNASISNHWFMKAIDELRLNVITALPHELPTAIRIIGGYAYLVLEDADKIDPKVEE